MKTNKIFVVVCAIPTVHHHHYHHYHQHQDIATLMQNHSAPPDSVTSGSFKKGQQVFFFGDLLNILDLKGTNKLIEQAFIYRVEHMDDSITKELIDIRNNIKKHFNLDECAYIDSYLSSKSCLLIKVFFKKTDRKIKIEAIGPKLLQ